MPAPGPPTTPYDEAAEPGGAPRAHYAAVLDALAQAGPGAVAARVAEEARALGLTGSTGLPHFSVDPVPRIIPRAEWEPLAAGIAQRARALDAWVADAHGPRTAVAAGIVPAAVLESSRYLERDLVGIPPPAVRIGLGGPDVVRAPDGSFVVLEDNVRTPAMIAVALALRRCLAAALPELAPEPDALEQAGRTLVLDALAAAAPPGVAEPHAVVLVDRAESAFPWELEAFGPLLGLPVLGLEDLARRGDDVVLREGGRRVDVVLRRTSEERLRTDAGGLTALGELFVAPLRAGRVAVVNAFGTGVADDKRVFPHVEELVRFFLGEEPLVGSIPAADPAGDPRGLVFKPRSGSGGRGVLVGLQASPAELAETQERVRDEPGGWLVQELVRFSVHPSWAGGRLAMRHVDLRPYVSVHAGGARVLPGGLCRVALGEGDLVVNASRGGGGKDVWVV